MAKRRWDVGERVMFRASGARMRLPAHRHVNPHRRRSSGGGGGGGTNWGMIALIGGGAYLLLSSGMLGRAFGASTGQTVTPQQLTAAGYQDMGGGYYRNASTGQTIYRNPQTGQVQPSGGAVPAGTSPWLAPLYQIGQAAIPQIGAGIGSGIASLFNPSTWSNLFGTSPTQQPLDQATSDVLFGSPDLPPLDAPVAAWDWMNGDDWSFGGDTSLPPIEEPAFDLWGGGGGLSFDFPALPEPGGVSLYSPDLPEYGWVGSMDLSLAPVEPVYPDAGGWYSGDWF